MMGPLFKVVSLEEWPAGFVRTKKPQDSPFKATYSNTMDLLALELRKLNAKDVVLEADADWSHIRKDGQLRAEARLRSQGVILGFRVGETHSRYPCDAFNDWQDNLRAIALTLQALRKVKRYGTAPSGEQYRGWTKLPAEGGTSTSTRVQEAAAFLAKHGDATIATILTSTGYTQAAFLRAAKRLHPDVAGGTTQAFQTLQQAKEVLDRFHGLVGAARVE